MNHTLQECNMHREERHGLVSITPFQLDQNSVFWINYGPHSNEECKSYTTRFMQLLIRYFYYRFLANQLKDSFLNLVLSDYGFCFLSNPFDEVLLPMPGFASNSTSEISRMNLSSPFSNQSESLPVRLPTHPYPYSCTSRLHAMHAPLLSVMAGSMSDDFPLAATQFATAASSLTKTERALMCPLSVSLRHAYAAICRHEGDLLRTMPKNVRQEAAKTYRDGQISILEHFLRAVKSFEGEKMR